MGFQQSLTFREINIHKAVWRLLYIQNTQKFLRLMKNERHELSLHFTSYLHANANKIVLSDTEIFIEMVSQFGTKEFSVSNLGKVNSWKFKQVLSHSPAKSADNA